MDEQSRKALHDELTQWFYSNGDGLLLEYATKSVYLAARENLVRPIDEIVPIEARRRLLACSGDDLDLQRDRLIRRQFSLLRTQLKGDLAVYGRLYGPSIKGEDEAFLRECGVKINRKPWKGNRSER
jgi:hypothetical protein